MVSWFHCWSHLKIQESLTFPSKVWNVTSCFYPNCIIHYAFRCIQLDKSFSNHIMKICQKCTTLWLGSLFHIISIVIPLVRYLFTHTCSNNRNAMMSWVQTRKQLQCSRKRKQHSKRFWNLAKKASQSWVWLSLLFFTQEILRCTGVIALQEILEIFELGDLF